MTISGETSDEGVHPCAACHGQGSFVCVEGCHTMECDECQGSGYLHADDSPAPAEGVL